MDSPTMKTLKRKYAEENEKVLEEMKTEYDERVGKLAKQMYDAAKALMMIEKEMDTRAKEITGDDEYTVSFQQHGSVDDQLQNLGEYIKPGFEDVMMMARSLMNETGID
jgi:hypothetical protein